MAILQCYAKGQGAWSVWDFGEVVACNQEMSGAGAKLWREPGGSYSGRNGAYGGECGLHCV